MSKSSVYATGWGTSPRVAAGRAIRRALAACGCLLALASAQAAPVQQQDPAPSVVVRRSDTIQLAQADARRHTTSGEPIAVLFPDIGEPFRRIFAEIVDGIEDHSRLPVHSYPIGPNQDPADLAAALKRNGTRVVIALGRQGLKAGTGLDYPMVAGAVSSVPDADRASGILLSPDPALLFAQLKTLSPGVRRVFVVYNPANNDWIIKLARDAARSQNLELVAYEARDLATAARQYESLLSNADPRRDAVWLPQDPTAVDDATILPLALGAAWSRNLPVFSSNLAHVKRGLLFALYPDNTQLGRSLSALALAAMNGDIRRGVLPLREVHSALNLRTANHIGLNVGPKLQRSFDVVYSEP